ncbi:MAG: lipopolysaccharide kinase InaA family protein [Candidatus Sumerlaeaceae bacterium]|nr:lipopolysaccharide kinase InaA family protein [Candidatus Sumerlaeaceae bacterium]
MGWLGDLNRLFEDITTNPGTVLREGGGRGITSRREIGGYDVFCKMYRPDCLHRRLRDKFVGPRCLREWYANCLVSEAGIATAPIVAALCGRRRFSNCQLVISRPAPGHSLAHWLNGQAGDLQDRTAFLGALAGFVAHLHALGLCHPHLHAKHIFLSDSSQFMLIDLDRATLCQPLPYWRRLYNVRQMSRSLRRFGSDEDAECFVREYWALSGLKSGRPPASEVLCASAAALLHLIRQMNAPWRTRKVIRRISVSRNESP